MKRKFEIFTKWIWGYAILSPLGIIGSIYLMFNSHIGWGVFGFLVSVIFMLLSWTSLILMGRFRIPLAIIIHFFDHSFFEKQSYAKLAKWGIEDIIEGKIIFTPLRKYIPVVMKRLDTSEGISQPGPENQTDK